MNDTTLRRLDELIDREVLKIVDKGDMSLSELEIVDKAVCISEKIDNLNKSRGMNGPMGFSEMRGRDPMTGRYMSRSDGMMSNGGYYMGSYGMMPEPSMPHAVVGNSYGYSGHSLKDRLYKAMEREYEHAASQEEKDMIQKYMHDFMAE